MDEKKKIAILGGLFVVIIGIGAFQFAKGGGSDTPTGETVVSSKPQHTEQATTEKTPGKPASEESDVDANGEVVDATVDPGLIAAARLNPRDPFDGSSWDVNLKAAPTQPSVPAPKQRPTPPPMKSIGGSGFKPMPIGDGVLPNIAGTADISGGKLPSIEDFPYTVAGTMVGDRSFVLLKDASGKQKLVSEGSSIDGDSRVISISKGQVTVKHRGKTKTFRVGGNPSNDRNEDKQ